MTRITFQLILFGIFIGLFSLSFQIGAMSKVSYEEASAYNDEFQSLMEETNGIGIFVNNSLGALPMFIPGFGIAWGLYTSWSTGFGFAAIISTMPGLSDIPPLSILFLSPFGVMELVAYCIALSCSLYLIYIIIKKIKSKSLHKTSLNSEIKITIIQIGIVLALLLVAGFLEEYMIKAAQGGI